MERDLQVLGSEKMERVGDREKQMESYYPTGESPQRAVAPTEEEEEKEDDEGSFNSSMTLAGSNVGEYYQIL